MKLGIPICQSLPTVHALTGSDSTSSFYKIGKKTVFDTLIKTPEIFESLQFLEVLPTNEAVDAARNFVQKLYKQKSCTSLDELRYNMTMKTKSAAELPPTEGAFLQHVLRYVLTYQRDHIILQKSILQVSTSNQDLEKQSHSYRGGT